MDRAFFMHCRARSGKGKQRNELANELWFADNHITHLIIAGAAGVTTEQHDEERKAAEAKRNALIETLKTLVHLPTEDNHV